MLRLSRDRLLVSLAPTTMSWARLTGGFRPRVIAKRSMPATLEAGEAPWEGALAVLQEEAEHWRRDRLAVTVVLSNHFVRYIVVPPLDRGSSRDEALALARFHFARIHGERAAAWHVRLASPMSGRTALASAIDAALLEALKSCFPPHGKPRLTSVQPYTMSAFNFWRHKIGQEGAWLLLVEPDTVCLALLAGKQWATIHSMKSGHAAGNWPALLDREKHRANVQNIPRTVYTRAAVPPSSALGVGKDWHFVMLDAPALPGLTQNELEPYAMALQAA
ncbi:MAG TPA: hypothetical protein VGP15_12850 [Burkholderiales bacterium]|nr:hypothetical protein [Burkholderiales bacterium]